MSATARRASQRVGQDPTTHGGCVRISGQLAEDVACIRCVRILADMTSLRVRILDCWNQSVGAGGVVLYFLMCLCLCLSSSWTLPLFFPIHTRTDGGTMAVRPLKSQDLQGRDGDGRGFMEHLCHMIHRVRESRWFVLAWSSREVGERARASARAIGQSGNWPSEIS